MLSRREFLQSTLFATLSNTFISQKGIASSLRVSTPLLATQSIDVPMFRGNAAHTFYGTGPIREAPQIRWTFPMGRFRATTGKIWAGTGWTGTAAVVGDTVYIGSQDSFFYALDRKTGKLRWKFQTGAMFKGSCAVFAGRVFTGCVDNNLYCFDAATGQLLWKYNTGHDCDSSPTIYNNCVYIAGESGFVHCFRPDTGRLVWRTFVDGLEGPDGSDGSETTPAIAEGRVFVANFTGQLYALNADNGAILWVAKTGDDTDASPVVANNMVYISAEEKSPYLFAFDVRSGRLIWRFGGDFTRGFWSTPAVVGNRLYIGAENKKMYCLDALSGKLLWEFETGGAIWSSPAVVDDRVVFGSYDSHLYVLNTDGKELSRIRLQGRILSSPCIVNGHIYIGTAEGMFYCLV